MDNTTEKKNLPEQSTSKIKRGKGEGQLSYRWYIYYSVDYKGLKLHKKAYGDINSYHTIEEREAAAKRLIEQIDSGEFFKRPTGNALEKLFQIYWSNWKRSLRKKTEATHNTKLAAFLDYCRLHDLSDVKKISPEFARQFLATIDRSNATINSYRECLCTMFGLFIKDNIRPLS